MVDNVEQGYTKSINTTLEEGVIEAYRLAEKEFEPGKFIYIDLLLSQQSINISVDALPIKQIAKTIIDVQEDPRTDPVLLQCYKQIYNQAVDDPEKMFALVRIDNQIGTSSIVIDDLSSDRLYELVEEFLKNCEEAKQEYLEQKK